MYRSSVNTIQNQENNKDSLLKQQQQQQQLLATYGGGVSLSSNNSTNMGTQPNIGGTNPNPSTSQYDMNSMLDGNNPAYFNKGPNTNTTNNNDELN